MKADVLPAAARYPWDGGPHGLDPDTDTDTRVRQPVVPVTAIHAPHVSEPGQP